MHRRQRPYALIAGIPLIKLKTATLHKSIIVLLASRFSTGEIRKVILYERDANIEKFIKAILAILWRYYVDFHLIGLIGPWGQP